MSPQWVYSFFTAGVISGLVRRFAGQLLGGGETE